MFLESSQKTLIEYHHDNVQIHGHGPWVCPSIGLTPSVVCFWNFHRKCWWYQTLAIPISVAMAMAMSIFEYFGSCWSFFWRPSGLLVGSTVYPDTTDIWARILLPMYSDLQHEASWSIYSSFYWYQDTRSLTTWRWNNDCAGHLHIRRTTPFPHWVQSSVQCNPLARCGTNFQNNKLIWRLIFRNMVEIWVFVTIVKTKLIQKVL